MQRITEIYYILDGKKYMLTAVGIDERFDCLDYIETIGGDIKAIIDKGIDE